jgi:SAM-dependent methyltransferase
MESDEKSAWLSQHMFVVERRPEMAAGGYARDDGTVEFYQRVMSLLPEGAVVLDLGAGRGAAFGRDQGNWKNWLIRLGNRHSKRIGVDVDPIVKTHAGLDEAVTIKPGAPLPFRDRTFDIVLCDWVLEHIYDVEGFIAEVRRVLKTGGWFCARTPNKNSYFSLAARMVPRSIEGSLLKVVQPERAEGDVFPKYYRLNSLSAIRSVFTAPEWVNASYAHNPTPSYHGRRPWLFKLLELWQSALPASMGTVILVFARRQV